MLKHSSSSEQPVERHLFHGTSINALESICHNNFDPHLSGANDSAYGKGSYFSSQASYSNRYSGVEYSNCVECTFNQVTVQC